MGFGKCLDLSECQFSSSVKWEWSYLPPRVAVLITWDILYKTPRYLIGTWKHQLLPPLSGLFLLTWQIPRCTCQPSRQTLRDPSWGVTQRSSLHAVQLRELYSLPCYIAKPIMWFEYTRNGAWQSFGRSVNQFAGLWWSWARNTEERRKQQSNTLHSLLLKRNGCLVANEDRGLTVSTVGVLGEAPLSVQNELEVPSWSSCISHISSLDWLGSK